MVYLVIITSIYIYYRGPVVRFTFNDIRCRSTPYTALLSTVKNSTYYWLYYCHVQNIY